MHLHVVAFNIPWPADYGGVIDVFCRVKALAEAGVKVHLHCYAYGRTPAPALEQLCEEVCYYQRRTGFCNQLAVRPYIVQSRQSRQLLSRLQADNYPILLEGLHCCSLLEHLDASRRAVYVRAHNVEHDYYSSLAQAETTSWRRSYYRIEANKLRRYEPVMLRATAVLAISDKDAAHFRDLGCRNVVLLPPCHGNSNLCALPGRGDYALYHGNLSVPENEKAVRYLLQDVFADGRYRFIVAGRNPSDALREAIVASSCTTLVANPDDETLDRLISQAQVNILVTDQATGVKLKLLNALYRGRFCLVNSTMVQGTDLAQACMVADTPAEQRTALNSLMALPFTEQHLQQRKAQLKTFAPAETIISLIESTMPKSVND